MYIVQTVPESVNSSHESSRLGGSLECSVVSLAKGRGTSSEEEGLMPNATGTVVWFTGLSGAGKSTICTLLADQLRLLGKRTQVLDGDSLRRGLCEDLGFSTTDRRENVRRVMHVASLLAGANDFVLVALITPFQELRDMIRLRLSKLVEVYVEAPLSVCEQRDPKGLYKRARRGELTDFTGLDSPFEVPSNSDLTCQTHLESIEKSTDRVRRYLLRDQSPEQVSPARARRRTLAVDFDGVIANYDGWQGRQKFGSVRLDVVAALQQLREEGWKIVIHTTRGAEDVSTYLVEAEIPFDEINQNSDYETCGTKPVATVYWDDRALQYSGDALSDLPLIRTFKTWCNRD